MSGWGGSGFGGGGGESSGDIDGVTAGAGLTGGGTSGTVALALGFVGGKASSGAGTTTATTNTDTPIAIDTVEFDVGGYFNAGTPTRFTVPAGKAGYYLLTGFLSTPDSTGTYVGYHKKNGTTYLSRAAQVNAAGNGQMGFILATIANLAEGDWVEMVIWQNTGSDRAVGAGFSGTFLGS